MLTAEGAVPPFINYQGRLTDTEGSPLDGAYDITFRIYDSLTEGISLWDEIHAGVTVEKGIFSVMLGSLTPLDLAFDKQYFLELSVGDEIMGPRQKLISVPYAMRAEYAGSAKNADNAVSAGNADTIDGNHASSFVNLSEKQTISGAKTITASSPITPDANTLYSDNLIKAWGKINCPSAAVADGFNIASVSRTATGCYTINWKKPFVNDNYAVVVNYFMSPTRGFLFYLVTYQSAA